MLTLPTLRVLTRKLFVAEGKFGLWAGVVRDQETAHEEFFVRADGPNLTGNQIYCICRSRTRRRYTEERNITRYCSGQQGSAEIFVTRRTILDVRSGQYVQSQ